MPTTRGKGFRISAQFYLGLTFWIAQVVIIFSTWRYLPPQLPFFYSRPWGEEQLSTPLGLLILPGLSVAIFLVNFIFTQVLPQEEVLMKQILTAFATVFSLLCLITLTQIVRLVI